MEKEASKEALIKYAVETVDTLMGDIGSSLKRGMAVFGERKMLCSVIPSFLGYGAGVSITPQTGEIYTGERRDLRELLGCEDWVSAAFAIAGIAKKNPRAIRAGDYFRIPIKAESGSFGGLDFDSLDIPEAELVVVQVSEGGVILNFEEVLFYSAVNKKLTSEGGFKNSALSQYLNGPFLAALDPIKGILAKNRDGNFVALPTFYEVFGDNEYGDGVNWESEPRRLAYFKNTKNRIRVKDNNTRWWWLSSEASTTRFAGVHGYGDASFDYASSTGGGVAPVIRLRGILE
jgi:hypothetical protein